MKKTRASWIRFGGPVKEGARVKLRLIVRMLVCLVVFVGLRTLHARSQQEVDPDHFDSSAVEPIPQTQAAHSPVKSVRYDASFSLPYSVRCSGKKLAPGTYSVSLRSDGRVARGVLRSAAQAIETASVVRTQAAKPASGVVVVKNQQNLRTLSAICIKGFTLVFDPINSDSRGENNRISRLPLRLLAATPSLKTGYP